MLRTVETGKVYELKPSREICTSGKVETMHLFEGCGQIWITFQHVDNPNDCGRLILRDFMRLASEVEEA
jgi:hypothetical protein